MAEGNNTNQFVNAIISALIAAIVTLGTVLIYAGQIVNRVEQTERRTEKLDNAISGIQQTMVTKDDLKEVRSDIKVLTNQVIEQRKK
jgi:hypothetical protein